MIRCDVQRGALALCALAVLLAAGCQKKQQVSYTPDSGAPPAPTADSSKLSKQQLDALVARIALYPDVLIAHILPASTAPLEVVEAARYLQDNQDHVTGPPPDTTWNPSIVVLLQFPDILNMMSNDLPWTQELGHAVATQQRAVMKAIQRIRQAAQAAGNLSSNDKQVVEVQEGNIVIVPATAGVVYVPTYNPSTVTVAGAAAVGFGVGIATNAAIAADHCDWTSCTVYHGAYYHAGYYHSGYYHAGCYGGYYHAGYCAHPPYPAHYGASTWAHATSGYGLGVGRAGFGGQAGLGGGLAGAAGLGRGPVGSWGAHDFGYGHFGGTGFGSFGRFNGLAPGHVGGFGFRR